MFRVSLQLSWRIVCCLLALTGSLFSSDLLAVQNIEKNRTILTLVPEYKDQIIANFNPYSKASMPTTHEFIFEPLVVFNSLQNNQPEYRLATSYQLDDDLSGISFRLREGVTWSDGKPFTADDVVFSFFLAKTHPELDSHGINQWLGAVQKRSPTEVYFKLNKPNALAAYTLVLLPIVPKHQWQNVSDPIHFANASPIGTGPFTQIEDMDENGYLQCQNPFYWQADERKIDCLRYPKVTNNDDFIARIAKGEFDWAGSFIPDIERHYASYSPDFKYWLPPASTISLMFNFKAADPGLRAVISKVEFRRAISMAVRRQRLIDIAAFGQGEPSRFASGMSQRFSRWADPVVTEKYLPYMSFNPELAEDWLTYIDVTDKNGDQWRDQPSGEPLELTILTPRGWSDFNITALLLTEMMQEIGIKIRPIEVNYSEFIERLTAGDYVTALTNYPQGPTPFKYFDMAFNSAYQAPQYPRYAMHFYRNDRIDALLAQFPMASSANKRLAILHELNYIVASQQITVPLYNTVQFYQYNTQRFTGWFNENNPKANPLVWPQTPERLLHVLALRPKE
ncbi:ABC transporter substrate-binding protein [Photobacterium lipolyticum]|uniref:Peptide ABC transporter substrate-binding protein n=1 Tax=Photobacterium lipolyticum TaxID=266810 RepID=A0A2T3MVS7_9GAMM|nr:ABC transporter substrate-binding protein [Photobacterium lipolyticum]PSW04083.1 peptide ABC transporter substrate-binding protein [Photobacterium lipolyticum]